MRPFVRKAGNEAKHDGKKESEDSFFSANGIAVGRLDNDNKIAVIDFVEQTNFTGRIEPSCNKMTSDYTLVLNVILDWDDFAFNEGSEEPDQTVIRKKFVWIIRDTDVTASKIKVFFQDRNTKNLYYETESIVRFTATISFDGVKTEARLKKLLTKLVTRDDMTGMYLSLNACCEEQLYPKLSLSGVSQKSQVKSFHLGTVVGVGNFVSFFDSSKVNPQHLKFQELEIHFRHDLASMHIQFYDPQPPSRTAYPNAVEVGCWYEMRIKYERMHSAVIHPNSDTVLEFLLVLKCPPLLYRKICYADPSLNRRSAFIRESTFNMKCPLGVSDGQKKLSAKNFGKCNAISIRLPLVRDEKKKPFGITCPWKMTSTLKKFLDLTSPIPFYISRLSLTTQEKFMSPMFVSSDSEKSDTLFLPDFILEKDNFDVYYALQCCLNLSHQFLADLTLVRKFKKIKNPKDDKTDWTGFKKLIEEKCKEDASAFEQTFYDIFHSLERNSFIRVLKDFEALFKKNVAEAKYQSLSIPGISMIRRAVLTPTRLILMPPHPFVLSRFFSHCDPSFGIRVQIRDDDALMLSFTIGQGSDDNEQLLFLKKSIQNPIMSGIQIGPHRRYEFLASTSSQLREHGLILYTMDAHHRRARDLRKQIGDFSKIKCVGKHIARLGQAFSQMISSVVIDDTIVEVKRIEDIKRDRKSVV